MHRSIVPDGITEVMLICEVMNQINQCTVQWDVSNSCFLRIATCVHLHMHMHACIHVYLYFSIICCAGSSVIRNLYSGKITIIAIKYLHL